MVNEDVKYKTKSFVGAKTPPLTEKAKMKKFNKLLLVIATVFSFICFLFYKIQYDKLYNVLQVLEFFGTAEQPPEPNHNLDHRVLTGLLPTWQFVTAELFIYSSFCIQNDVNGCSKVIALAAATEKAAADSDLGCKLWYEGTVRPVNGIFTSSGLLQEDGHHTSNLKPYILTCESKFPSMVPFGLSVTIGRLDGFVHVTVPKLPVPTEDEPLIKAKTKKKDMVACIGPQDQHEDSTHLLTEQVLLQHFFQISNFVVYDAGVTNKFVATIMQAKADQDGDFPSLQVDVLPWNSPPGLDSTASQMLVRSDCHYRTKSLYESNVFLKIGQILVLRSKNELFLANLLKRIAPSGAKMDVTVRKFCSEAPLDAPSAAVEYSLTSLRKSNYDSSASEPKVSIMYNTSATSEEVFVPETDLLVHDYGSCQNYDIDDSASEKIDDFLVKNAKPIQLKIGKYFSKIK